MIHVGRRGGRARARPVPMGSMGSMGVARWGWHVHQVGRWLPVDQLFVGLPPGKDVPIIQVGVGAGVAGWYVGVLVHGRDPV